MKNLQQQLLSGASLRYRPGPHGFFTVLAGRSTPVAEATARKAIKAGLVRPSGVADGVYQFALSHKNAMPALPSHPKALSKRPAALPNALPRVHLLRREADPKNPAAVRMAGDKEAGRVPGGAGRVDCEGAQRDRAAPACKADCMGSGRCPRAGEKEVMA